MAKYMDGNGLSHFMAKVKAAIAATVTGVKGNAESTYRTGQVNLTAANVGAVDKSGDTMTGTLTLVGERYSDDNATAALRLQNSNIIGVNSIYTADRSDTAQEGIHFYRDSTHVDSIHARDGDLFFTPFRALGTSGDSRLVTTYVNEEVGTTHFSMRPYVDQCRANRLAFLPASQILVEKTTDGGATWVSYGASDGAKTLVFSTGGNFEIPRANGARSALCGVRVTISGMRYNVPDGTAELDRYAYWGKDYVQSNERYFNVREWWFWVGSNGDRIGLKMERATGTNPGTWTTFYDGLSNENLGLEGWSGSSWVKAGGGGTFGGGTNQLQNWWNYRLTFMSKTKKGATSFSQTSAQNIYKIRCYGDNVWGASNNLMNQDHLYTYNSAKDAMFPASIFPSANNVGCLGGSALKWNSVYATTFYGNLAGGIRPDTTRPASANTTGYGGHLRYLLATSSMTTGKPTAGDGHILDMEWDNNGKWHGQLVVPTDATKHVQWRTEAGGTWMAWTSLLDAKDLSSATNSSSEELAATPKAVKAAYDLANTASTTAGQAMSAATGALAFKVTYSVEDGAVTCYAHVFSAGSEVTENYEDECFDWSMTLDGGTSWVVLGTGKEMPLTAMTAFGGNVKCDFTPDSQEEEE